jgi:uncharacterized protein HemY
VDQGEEEVIALGIILLMLCLLFLVVILFRQEFKDWRKERKARRASMKKMFNIGDKHGK